MVVYLNHMKNYDLEKIQRRDHPIADYRRS
jgi:hypothetical protein